LIGQTLSHYRITAALGAGGMGEVYRATDTNLRRDVAIKVLPPEVAQDEERLARFRREAHLLASLNHPNIAAIYGLEEADGKPFLALELVEGEDLKQRLARGAVPLDEALEIAERGSMRLHECDAHLEWARLCRQRGDRDGLQRHVARARWLVEETRYGRRRREVEWLEKALTPVPSPGPPSTPSPGEGRPHPP